MPLDNPSTPQGLGALDRPGISLDEINPSAAAALLGETAESEESPPEGDVQQYEQEAADFEADEAEASTEEVLAEDDQGEAEAPDEEDTATADEGEQEWSLPGTLPELAESLGVTTEDLADLRVTTKVDGEQGEVSLSQLIKSHQLESHLGRQQQAFAESRKAAEAELEATRQQLADEYSKAQQVSQVLLSQMLPPEPDAQLRQDDPAEYAAQMADRRQAEERISKIQHELGNKQTKYAQEQQRKAQEQLTKLVAEGREKLREYDSDWSNDRAQTVAKWLVSDMGFSNDEVNTAYDWRLVKMADMARKYATEQRPKTELAKKKVAKGPKRVMRPGASQRSGPRDSEIASLNKTRQRFRKSGSLDDAYELLVGAKELVKEQ